MSDVIDIEKCSWIIIGTIKGWRVADEKTRVRILAETLVELLEEPNERLRGLIIDELTKAGLPGDELEELYDCIKTA